MLNNIWIILFFIIPFGYPKEKNEESIIDTGDYVYLSHQQMFLQFNLSSDVFFDRKKFRNIWIYRNGFITLGDSLEEDDYPIMTGRDHVYQPFENLVGSNIIAAFVTANKITSGSHVRARQVSLKFCDSITRTKVFLYEKKIRKIYGTLMVSPLKSVLEIEWLRVEPVGGKRSGKNTFRLLLLSSDVQTFCVFEFENIEQVYYQYSQQRFSYQSGLSSYSYAKYKLPLLDRLKGKLYWMRSSNVGLENVWIITIGDSSYSIDIGWPSHKTDDSLTQTTTIFSRDIMAERNKNNARRFSRLPSKASIQFKSKPWIRKTSTPRTKSKRNIKEYDGLLNDNGDDLLTKTAKVSTLTSSSTFRNRRKNILDYFFSTTTESIELTGWQKSETSGYPSTLSKMESVSREKHTMTTKIKASSSMETESIKNINAGARKTSVTTTFSNIPESTSWTTYRTPVFKIFNDAEATPFASKLSSNHYYRREGALNNTPLQCSQRLCRENEDCFLSNNEVCCRCQNGTVFGDRKCLKNDEPFDIRSSGTAKIWNFNLSLMIIKTGRSGNSELPKSYLMLISNHDISQEVRNFLLLLHPLFYVPMSFYASPWKNETVPNMSSLVSQMAGIHIKVAIGEYEDIYVSFKLDRQDGNDLWDISINGTDMKKLKNLNLATLKFDEKSNQLYNIMYDLLNRNLIDFPEQSVYFQDENKNQSLRIRWRGTMTFSATCLSNFIENGRYFIKLSEKSYCNSVCELKKGNDNCRIMCLSFPHVFDRIPEACEGNFCEQNRLCVNVEGHQYECRCPTNFWEVDGNCVNHISEITTQPYLTTRYLYRSGECPTCMNNVNCRTFQFQECTVCQNGRMDSYGSCIDKDHQYEISSNGTVQFMQDNQFTVQFKPRILLLFRQYQRNNQYEYATFFEITEFPYSTDSEKKFFHFVLLLSPVFDIPLAYFARSINRSDTDNLCILSKGSLSLRIKIESTLFQPIDVLITQNALSENFELLISVIGVPVEFDEKLFFDPNEFFDQRSISTIVYTIKDNRIKFKESSITLPSTLKNHKMWWYGSGDLHKCAWYQRQRQFAVQMDAQYDCKVKCQQKLCKLYCQTVPLLQEMMENNLCSLNCHQMAKCVNGICICSPGFSGNGTFCFSVKKIQECSSTRDCWNQTFVECRNNKCECITGYQWRNNQCVIDDRCRFCKTNEICVDGDCKCESGFNRNRISQNCVFDCSVCDIYSTKCDGNRCQCLPGFISSKGDSRICNYVCSSDEDCPTSEKCSSAKICECPYPKQNGVCQIPFDCNSCHKRAVCNENSCTCQKNYIGDGINCSYNCSLCFDKTFCTSEIGCSCPPGFRGNGITCQPSHCGGKCPDMSNCLRLNGDYQCVCLSGFFMDDGKCVRDIVTLNILPSDPEITLTEGSMAELICIAVSKFGKFEIFWSRMSGKTISGIPEYLSMDKQSIRLRISSVTIDDSDQYICRSSMGQSKSTNITIIKAAPRCSDPCSIYATCGYDGKCRCVEHFFGNGLNCTPEIPCQDNCSQNKICDRKVGECVCRPGFVNYQKGCISDCRKHLRCDTNANCSSNSGLCSCNKPFIGNGTHCWKPASSCSLTKRCANNSKCLLNQELQIYLCVCDSGYVGDGFSSCLPKIDCATHKCGRKRFCEPFIMKNELGGQVQNGRCTCEPRYISVNNICTEDINQRNTFWLSMGESLIRHGIEETISKIEYIETSRIHGSTGKIIALAGCCSQRRLIWSSDDGTSLRSANINKVNEPVTHLFNLGKVTGISVDQITGNVYFIDSLKGTIGVLDMNTNASRLLIKVDKQLHGLVAVHEKTGKLFWIVNEFQNPRIKTSDLAGKNESIFFQLKQRASSLVITSEQGKNDQLCWIEINDFARKLNKSSTGHTRAILKCISIGEKVKMLTKTAKVLYKIAEEDPFSALTYFENKFYWSVRTGAFLKSWDRKTKKESRLDIRPNCCDTHIRGLAIIPSECNRRKIPKNPCLTKEGTRKCPGICIPKIAKQNQMKAICL